MYEIALEVLFKITSFGYKAFLVGGYPRDLFLDLPSTDMDICTSATPVHLKKIFENFSLREGKYGSLLLYYKNFQFEITTFRREIVYEKHRFPVIEYVDDLLIDLKRRDFIMNTLCIDVNGAFIDLLGAKSDLHHRFIRVVGDTEKKLTEDPLRMLRAIRFATILNFTLDPYIIEVIRKNREFIRSLSYFRKKSELDKIFSSSHVQYGFDLMKKCDLFDVLELFNVENIVMTDSIGIYSQLSMSFCYPFSKEEKNAIEKIRKLVELDILSPFVLYQYGSFFCSIAADIKGIPRIKVYEKYNGLPIHKRKDIDITVSEICAFYHKDPGPYLKEIFSVLEEKILDGQLKNEKEEIKEFLKHTL